MLLSNKKTLTLYILMLVLEIIVGITILSRFGFNFYQGGDSPGYMLLAKNLVEHKTLSLDGSEPYRPNNFRTPGYPLFLALVYLIFHSFVPAMFLGALISAFAAPLVYLIAKEIFTEKVAFIAGVFTAIEPMGLFLGISIVTEGIFTSALFLFVFCFIKYLKTEKYPYLLYSAALLGAATLIRPIMFYFWPFAIFFVIYKMKHFGWYAVFKNVLIFIVVFIAVLSPWSIRNKIALSSWQITGVQGDVFFIDHYGAVLRYLGEAGPLSDVINKAIAITGADDRFTPKGSDILFKAAVKGIKEHKLAYINVYAKSLISFFVANGYKSLFIDILGIPAKAPFVPFELFLRFDLKSISKTFHEMNFTGFLIYWGSKLFWIAIFISFLASIIYLLFNNYRPILLEAAFIATAVLYFAIITGPTAVGGGRTRAPINGLVFIFATFSIYKFFEFLKEKFKL